jgi:4-amino-4-deoxy-L-arabinose transferase-like glycosyltransferase
MASPQQLQDRAGAIAGEPGIDRSHGSRPSLDVRASAIPIAIVAVAAVLRLWAIKYDAQNPYYDAAVRSMGNSWHNFFFGALDPSGKLGIDKPPVDLWLQVASTKLLGFTRTALALPEALGGIAAVALLYAAVTRACGWLAGGLAALALAVLPIAVLTSRSDTMDSVMSALLVAALWSSIVAVQNRQGRYVLLSAALVGVAFNVKLTQALVPVPALALMWWAASRPGKRIALGAGAVAVFAVVAMAWVFTASLTPLSGRPFPIGSHTGSIYKAMFVFNGIERLTGASHELAPYGTTSPPGLGRLLGSGLPHYAMLIGLELVAALTLLVAAAVLWLLDRDRHTRRLGTEPATPGERTVRWLIATLVVWLATAYVLFSFTGHLQPRYLEAMSPAVAAALGIATAYLLARAAGARLVRVALLAVASLALLAGPAEASIDLVEERAGDANPSGAGNQFSAYLRAHRHGARYEAAASNPLAVVGLIAQDGQPVLILRTIDGELVSVTELRRLVHERAVRFVLIPNPCTSGRHCATTTAWSLRNSVMIHPGLYRYLPPSRLR